MKQRKIPSITVCSVVCLLLLACMFVLAFVPFWNQTGESLSQIQYIWFPGKHEALTAVLEGQLGAGNNAESLYMFSLTQLLAPIISLCLLLNNKKGAASLGCSLICSAVVALGYLIRPAFRMGTCWPLHMLLALVTAVLSGLALYSHRRKK